MRLLVLSAIIFTSKYLAINTEYQNIKYLSSQLHIEYQNVLYLAFVYLSHHNSNFVDFHKLSFKIIQILDTKV